MIRIIRRQSPPHVAVLLACQQWLWASSAVQNLLLAELAFRFVDYSVRRHTPIQAIRCELLVVVEVVLDERTHVTVLALAGAVSALVERFRRIVRFAQPADMCAAKQRIILQPVGQGSRRRTQIELDRCEQPLPPPFSGSFAIRKAARAAPMMPILPPLRYIAAPWPLLRCRGAITVQPVSSHSLLSGAITCARIS